MNICHNVSADTELGGSGFAGTGMVFRRVKKT